MEQQFIIVILVSLFFSAFFSGSEIAFISANKLHIELGKGKAITGRILTQFLDKPSHFISTTLIGNTTSLVVYGIFMARILEPWIVSILPDAINNVGWILLIQTIISTFIVLLTAEFLPKSLFMINPNWMLRAIALPMRIFYIIIYPIVLLIAGLSKFIITKLFGMKYEENKPVYGLTDLNNFIKYFQKDSTNAELEVDTKILDNALEFKSIKVRECLIPRTEIVAIDQSEAIEELKKAFVGSGHSKILIFKESIDNVVGYCHSQALFKKPKKIGDILTEISFVPETMLANELLFNFIEEHKSMALVVDEFGGTSGLVTLEDVIEEIFGEIHDEHDDEGLVEQKLSENIYLLSARHEIDYLNDKYFWDLPEGEYETLGGLILSITEDLPSKNQIIVIDGFEFKVDTVHHSGIETVSVTILDSK